MQPNRDESLHSADASNERTPNELHDITDPRRRWTYSSPAPVFDADGQQIGTLSLGSPGDYLVIQRANAGGDLYLPLSAVNRSDASGIYLSLTRADLEDARWLSPPA